MRRPVLVTWFAVLCLSACGQGTRSLAEPPAPAQRSLESYFPLAELPPDRICDAVRQRSAYGQPYADPETRLRRKVIVSDLHLGPGDPGQPAFTGLEDFFFHDQWDRFLTAQEARGPTDLVIAGDFMELWQILGALDLLPARDSGVQQDDGVLLGADQAGSTQALAYVVAAHARTLQRLGEFVSRGDNRIIFIAGNHDADLLWPRVRLGLVRAMGLASPERLVFVDSLAYEHGGVHVEHGHQFDGANATALESPFGVDKDGACRLQSVWGEIFVAAYFNDVERQFPFADNIYPESAALMWAMDGEPDKLRVAATGVQFVDMLLSAQSKEFNLAALYAGLRGVVALPATAPGAESPGVISEVVDLLGHRFSSSDRAFSILFTMLTEPRLRTTWDAILRAARALPDMTAALSALTDVDLGALADLKDQLIGDSMSTAATNILAANPALDVVVFGHTHAPRGQVEPLAVDGRTGYYANTGAWVVVERVEDLQAAGAPWSSLSIHDDRYFHKEFPAVVIEYGPDGHPRPPVLVYAR